MSDHEGHGHKAIVYKSHFPPLRHSVITETPARYLANKPHLHQRPSFLFFMPPRQMGVPTLVRGYLPWMGYLHWPGGTYPGRRGRGYQSRYPPHPPSAGKEAPSNRHTGTCENITFSHSSDAGSDKLVKARYKWGYIKWWHKIQVMVCSH